MPAMTTDTITAMPVPVPTALAGPRARACRVPGYEMTGDDIRPGDVIIVDPDQPARDGDLAVVSITMHGKRGKVLRRITNGGRCLESSNPGFPPLPIGPENHPRADGRVVAVIRRL